MFGVIEGSTKLYYIDSWEDEYCDLTWDKMVDIIGKETILPEQLATIANVPSRNGLYSMLLSCLQGPIRNFLYGLKSVGEKKPQ